MSIKVDAYDGQDMNRMKDSIIVKKAFQGHPGERRQRRYDGREGDGMMMWRWTSEEQRLEVGGEWENMSRMPSAFSSVNDDDDKNIIVTTLYLRV